MDVLQEYKEKVELALADFLKKKIAEDAHYSKDTREIIANILEFNLRNAKRIRPILAIFAYKCFKDDDKAVEPSIALELMQSYLLIHDDIIDKSDLRRGKPSMHKIYGKENSHLGQSIAILAGNLCASYMYESVLESDFNEKQKLEAIKCLCWINDRENYGQELDSLPGFEKLKEEDIMKIYELKTATYTAQGPILFGAALADAPKDKTRKMQEYAYNLGVAFQIQDDIKGIFSNVEEIGKPIDSDIKEGKKTILIIKALELCSKKDKVFLLKNYGDNSIIPENIGKIKQIITDSGALDYSKKKLSSLIQKSRESVKDVDLKKEGKQFLLEMADYIEKL